MQALILDMVTYTLYYVSSSSNLRMSLLLMYEKSVSTHIIVHRIKLMSF